MKPAPADLAACEAIAARDRSNLYLTSQFFADRARYDAFIAMYAAMRLIDDYIDDATDKSDAAVRASLAAGLDAWEQRVRNAYAQRPGAAALDRALAWAVSVFPVPLQLWLNFIDAMRFDVAHPRFRTFAEFLHYGEGATAAPTTIYVYLLAAELQSHGVYRVERFDYETCGRELGLFAYLAHILRDVKKDMNTGKAGLVYVAQEDMAKHGFAESDLRGFLASSGSDPRWDALVGDLCGRAEAMAVRGVALAEANYAHMEPDCAFILALIIGIYREMLRRIAAAPQRVLAGDPILGEPDHRRIAQEAAHRTGFALRA